MWIIARNGCVDGCKELLCVWLHGKSVWMSARIVCVDGCREFLDGRIKMLYEISWFNFLLFSAYVVNMR